MSTYKLDSFKTQPSFKDLKTIDETKLPLNTKFQSTASELKHAATILITNTKNSPNLQKFYPQIRTLFPMLKVVKGSFKCDSEFCSFIDWGALKPYKAYEISFIVNNSLQSLSKNRFFSPYFNKCLCDKNESLFRFLHKYANGYAEDSQSMTKGIESKHKRVCIFCINIIANIVSKYQLSIPA